MASIADTVKNSQSVAVTRALADIRAAQHGQDEGVVEFLDHIADMVKRSGDPRRIFNQAIDVISRSQLQDLLTARSLQIEEWTEDGLDESLRGKLLAHSFTLEDGLTIVVVPAGQSPATRLKAVRALLSHQEGAK